MSASKDGGKVHKYRDGHENGICGKAPIGWQTTDREFVTCKNCKRKKK